MTIAVIVESVVLVIVGFFVVALVYSYAGLHRRVEELADARPAPRSESSVISSASLRPAFDLVGRSPAGEVAAVAVAGAPHKTLLAFLSSGCTACQRFFRDLSVAGRVSLPADVRVVVVTKGTSEESPSAVAALCPGCHTLVMSSEAWRDYDVPGSPYFVLVDGPTGGVLGGGTGPGWKEVLDLLALATGDSQLEGTGTGRRSEAEREADIDEVLLAAGIGPGHPSLYPRDPRITRPAQQPLEEP